MSELHQWYQIVVGGIVLACALVITAALLRDYIVLGKSGNRETFPVPLWLRAVAVFAMINGVAGCAMMFYGIRHMDLLFNEIQKSHILLYYYRGVSFVLTELLVQGIVVIIVHMFILPNRRADRG